MTPDSKKKPFEWMEFLKIVALPLATVGVGYYINSALDTRQQRENNVRLYVEMMARREDADSGLRKDMFKSILDAFKEKETKAKSPEYLDEQILDLEMLAYNFNESIDMGPLFKYLRRRIGDRQDQPWKPLQRRLERVAQEVNERQLTSVGDSGTVVRASAELEKLPDQPADLFFQRNAVTAKDDKPHAGASRLCLNNADSSGERHHRQFKLEVIRYDADSREIQVRLYVSRPISPEDCQRADLDLAGNREIDTTFEVGMFDFPMIDNTRLTHGERCAVALTEISPYSVQLALAYFPGSRASLKDKPYYDEVVHQLLRGPSFAEQEETGGHK